MFDMVMQGPKGSVRTSSLILDSGIFQSGIMWFFLRANLRRSLLWLNIRSTHQGMMLAAPCQIAPPREFPLARASIKPQIAERRTSGEASRYPSSVVAQSQSRLLEAFGSLRRPAPSPPILAPAALFTPQLPDQVFRCYPSSVDRSVICQ